MFSYSSKLSINSGSSTFNLLFELMVTLNYFLLKFHSNKSIKKIEPEKNYRKENFLDFMVTLMGNGYLSKIDSR